MISTTLVRRRGARMVYSSVVAAVLGFALAAHEMAAQSPTSQSIARTPPAAGPEPAAGASAAGGAGSVSATRSAVRRATVVKGSSARLSTTSGAGVQRATLAMQVSASANLPDGWESHDVGMPSLPGGSAYAGGVFSVAGGGLDVWHTADQFHFAYTGASGDVDIVARIAQVDHLHPLMKAGVMIRASASADAAHAFVFTFGGRRFDFARRRAGGAWSQQDEGPPGRCPNGSSSNGGGRPSRPMRHRMA
jgi:hypothetical protein